MHTLILANIPSPPQGVWHLGPVPIRAYALCIVTGIIVAMWLTLRRYRAAGGNPDLVWDASIIVIIAGLIGGRTYHVITDYHRYFCQGCNPWDALKITNGGLGIIGAVALGAFGVWLYLRYRGVPMGPFADAVAPGLLIAQGIGRLGNWFNQELYGAPTTVPWALDIYHRVDEAGRPAPISGVSTGEVLASVHPTFLYEMLWNFAFAGVLIWAQRRWRLGHGRVFALYIAGYSFGRFFIEQMRTDEATLIFDIRVNVFVSLALFMLGVILFYLLPKGQEKPKEVDPQFHASSVAEGQRQE